MIEDEAFTDEGALMEDALMLALIDEALAEDLGLSPQQRPNSD